MTATELRQLDAWIAENVMGNQQRKIRVTDGRKLVRYEFLKVGTNEICPEYTTDPAAAMEVLKKCCEAMAVNVEIWKAGNGEWVCRMVSGRNSRNCVGTANTIELAICLFAKKLFTKD